MSRVYSHSFEDEEYLFQKKFKSTTPPSYTLFYFWKKILVMNMPVFNFHKMTQMHKGYAH
jgi:hypothetical protein